MQGCFAALAAAFKMRAGKLFRRDFSKYLPAKISDGDINHQPEIARLKTCLPFVPHNFPRNN
ncbi:MAG: hypothetical protein M3384_22360 [Acidobacteriota bacterium]|nr:hypothetical protein [Acidobacteriota bacterium]